jgi:ribonuclease T2
MFQIKVVRHLLSLGWLGLVALGAASASAQDRRQNAPGEFDFYVL